MIAGAALDVFTKEPYDKPIFQGLQNVILTPHLGASTKEAQDAVAVEAARAVANYFSEGISMTAVNLPAGETQIQEYKDHIRLAEKLGSLVVQLTNENIKKFTLLGPATMPKILMLAAIKGALNCRGDKQVSLINASIKAAGHGIALAQEIVETGQDFAGAFGVILEGEKERQEAWGAVLADSTLRIIMCDGHHVEISPEGRVLLIHNNDRPGIIGKVSSILGEAGINIAEMQNVRERKGADALTVIRVDDPLPDKTLEEIRNIDGVERATLMYL
jgi:D-3-phosphoglycerate dehydrogenase